MFETLSLPSRKSPMKRTALSFAIGLHAFALLLIFSSSLWALQPIQAPLPYVVYQATLIALPPPEGVPAPRDPAPKAPATTTHAAPTPPPVAQPVTVADPTVASTPAVADAAAATSSLTPGSAVLSGSPVGVPGGFDTTASSDSGFSDRRPSNSEIIHRPGGDVRAPRILEQVKPTYPSSAVAVGVEGIVIVQAVINESGRVEGATILRGHALLDEAALEAVAQWRFEPGRLNGRPVKVYFTLTVNFRLKR